MNERPRQASGRVAFLPMATAFSSSALEICPPQADPASALVLTPGAIRFLTELAHAFGPRVDELLERRRLRRLRVRAGEPFDFRADTAAVRENDWTVAPIPRDLEDRR